jgi:hypothetical protein
MTKLDDNTCDKYVDGCFDYRCVTIGYSKVCGNLIMVVQWQVDLEAVV